MATWTDWLNVGDGGKKPLTLKFKWTSGQCSFSYMSLPKNTDSVKIIFHSFYTNGIVRLKGSNASTVENNSDGEIIGEFSDVLTTLEQEYIYDVSNYDYIFIMPGQKTTGGFGANFTMTY